VRLKGTVLGRECNRNLDNSHQAILIGFIKGEVHLTGNDKLASEVFSLFPLFAEAKNWPDDSGQWRVLCCERKSSIGKTKKQAVDLLFAEVKSLVKDEVTLDSVWRKWRRHTEGRARP
jgi:hypothetical protein